MTGSVLIPIGDRMGQLAPKLQQLCHVCFRSFYFSFSCWFSFYDTLAALMSQLYIQKLLDGSVPSLSIDWRTQMCGLLPAAPNHFEKLALELIIQMFEVDYQCWLRLQEQHFRSESKQDRVLLSLLYDFTWSSRPCSLCLLHRHNSFPLYLYFNCY